ncbi:MAG: hypothetical protein SGARI_003910, partial [Bacillariaceae sp.]
MPSFDHRVVNALHPTQAEVIGFRNVRVGDHGEFAVIERDEFRRDLGLYESHVPVNEETGLEMDKDAKAAKITLTAATKELEFARAVYEDILSSRARGGRITEGEFQGTIGRPYFAVGDGRDTNGAIKFRTDCFQFAEVSELHSPLAKQGVHH